jgi:hypothetical protein
MRDCGITKMMEQQDIGKDFDMVKSGMLQKRISVNEYPNWYQK